MTKMVSLVNNANFKLGVLYDFDIYWCVSYDGWSLFS